MSVMLLLSSFVTTLMVPESAYSEGGKAAGRAIAYLSHALLGEVFGSAYDLFTVLVLWFAGASAMAGLLNLIPRYLPRFGMAPLWTSYRRPLVLVLFGFSLLVTWIFDANVEAQGSAYATGVLVLMLSAAFAVALALWREHRAATVCKARLRDLSKSVYFWFVTAVFAYTLVDNVIGRPAGVVIAGCFILTILVLGAVSRIRRSTELRVSQIEFADQESAKLWQEIVGRKIHLVPMKRISSANCERKAASLRGNYRIEGRLAFLHVELMDNRSDFLVPLTLRVMRSGGDVVLRVTGANAVANTIAYVSELLDPISLFVGLTGRNLMEQAARYLLWGEGEVGLMVYKILLRYWDWTPEDDLRPTIFLMSEGSHTTEPTHHAQRRRSAAGDE
jgi:predicted outer membrane lipoprotein